MYDSKLERDFHNSWKNTNRPAIIPQHKFHSRRQWRFDFAHVTSMVAIEIQGYGVGHNSYKGMKEDYEKHNEAVRLGWVIIYIMSAHLEKQKIMHTMDYIEEIIRLRPPELIQQIVKNKPRVLSIHMSKYEKTISQIITRRKT